MNAPNSPPMPSAMRYGQPSQQCGRNTYETGRAVASSTTQSEGVNIIPAASAFETAAIVMQAPGYVLQVDAAIAAAAAIGSYHLLAWDVRPTSAVLAAVLTGQMGAARYSWGPSEITVAGSGGMVVREPEEWFELDGQHFRAFPFDAGCIMALSTTPVMFTDPAADLLKLTVRTKGR